MARKSTFDPKIADRICERIGTGETLRAICREDGNPSYVTFYTWIKENPELAERFADARARGFDAIAAECLEIADDATNDFMDRKDADGEVVGQQLNAEHVQRSKLRIETRLKLLAKWDPKRYGEKIETQITGKDGGPVVMRMTSKDENL